MTEILEPHCHPWCCWPEDHPRNEMCWSAESYIDLSLYPAIDDHCELSPTATMAYVRGADQLSVSLGGMPDDENVVVVISHNGQDDSDSPPFFSLDLTFAEARQLIAAIERTIESGAE